jgi:hypothetical protein
MDAGVEEVFRTPDPETAISAIKAKGCSAILRVTE